ncbi:MAG: amidase [Pseudomonadota bacterium]
MIQDALALAEAIRGRKVTAVEAMKASIGCAETHEHLGAVSYTDAEAGLSASEVWDRNQREYSVSQVFGGIPFLVKDLGGPFKNWPVSAGSQLFLRTESREDQPTQSNLAARFEGAGLCIFGMTSVPEFGLSLTTEGTTAPPCRNPLAPDLTAGGSSGGAAAAVAQGIVSIAHATDAGGSIRVPAACCGLVGLKPSRGSIPEGPDFGNHLSGLATELAVCRSVRDARAAFAAVSNDRLAADAPPQLRIGLVTNTGEETPTCDDHLASAQQAAAALSADGHALLDLDWQDIEALVRSSADIFAAIICANLAELFQRASLDPSKAERITQAAVERGLSMSATDLLTAQNSMVRVAYSLCHIFDRVDCIIAPMLSTPPKPIGSFPMNHDDLDGHFAKMTAFAPPATLANVSGFPAITLPFGKDADGLPLPVQLIAPIGQEALLLSLAERLEAEQRWQHRFPVAGLPQ